MESIDDDVAATFMENGRIELYHSMPGFNMNMLDEFAVDLSLSDVDRIERYIHSDIGMQRFDWFRSSKY